MATTVFSTKGQLVIPKELRDAKGFGPGVRVEAVEHPEGVLIRIVPSRKKRPVSDLFGILKPFYDGPPISVNDMNEAVAESAVERYMRSVP